ncbi:MAG: hypothetical protein ACJ73D_05590 [Pyrinomonadaceae bacterium]
MDELDASWAEMLIAASVRASLEGRADVAEYLRLKATNDAIRAAGVKWLLDAFVEAAFDQKHPLINVEREEGYAFPQGASTMAGTRLTIRYGLRCLDVEAGWARLPAHGIMREAALARANILHFGRSRENQNLKLIPGPDLPQWITQDGEIFLLENARQHIQRLITD